MFIEQYGLWIALGCAQVIAGVICAVTVTVVVFVLVRKEQLTPAYVAAIVWVPAALSATPASRSPRTSARGERTGFVAERPLPYLAPP